MYIFISQVKTNNCYDVNTGHRYNVDILTIIKSTPDTAIMSPFWYDRVGPVWLCVAGQVTWTQPEAYRDGRRHGLLCSD